MCGIIGAFNLDENPAAPERAVRAGMERMRRRGPDEEGFFAAPGVALGHRRLAIIDLKTGQQPFTDPATGAVMVFNGEIYNFQSVRRELEARGRRFRTASDTEVLLQAYLEWGTACLDRLAGMFAFAIYDPRDRALLLARDRLGVKPLFYAQRGARLYFASALSALFCFDEIARALDLEAASHYLTTLRTTLGARTLIQDVRALRPGECLAARRGVAAPEVRQYWDFPVRRPADKAQPGLAAAAERVRELLTQSVREQLISDVPLGGFLSGGLDSSVIAALAGQLTGGHFDAYSVGYDQEGYHEWPFVRAATRFHRMHCHEIHLRPEDYPADWQWLIEQNGLPLSTPNEVPIYHLARALKRDFTVALSGEGADEVFGGYVMPYFSAYDFDRARRAAPGPGEPLTPLDKALRRLYRRPYFLCLADHFFELNSWVPFARKQALLTADAWERLRGDEAVCSFYEDLFRRFEGCSTFDIYMHVHARVNLEGLLFREDSSTMAASVEARVPYTDHRVVEYLFSLPDTYKMDWTNPAAAARAGELNVQEVDRAGLVESKILLRRAFVANVPEDILRRRKMSFPVPVREWFGTLLKPVAAAALRESALVGPVIRPAAARQLIETADRPDSGMALWPVTNLCLWQQAFNVS